ncbi:MAG: type II toxin-antitoxin system PemK/MazF family toxin [Planctomycetota bacterium]|nr:MAG: type II toxin-antitoxin system PemK/MazF family toxin [Planctomycetota bacterium]REJ91175.1 MAG: type II toxin-antitoxin system PemK/MazF family toxin [Planctomycetota bacterium]REK20347.1 MAG: type II toxin-antitoxin system PemK/MazF family toxin [Planctomycetota bacterium]REK26844.1 MAG: type II toxin-antitoxin system PemK/MazF family toxin [Planctomycetota bacterium]
MTVRRGEIVLVDFPFSDQTGRKVRPALVVQNDQWNRVIDDTILALITGSRRRRIGAATQFVSELATPEGQQSGLRLDSIVQCENLVTYDQNMILKRLGSLPQQAMTQIDECLNSALGIA